MSASTLDFSPWCLGGHRPSPCPVVTASAQEKPAWLPAARRAVQALAELKAGWDSYRAKPIRPEVAEAVLDLLHDIMRPTTPVPAFVPTAQGTIQIEWHMRGIDLEINVRSATNISAYFTDARTGDEWEAKLGANLSRLRTPISILSGK
jgi:hypothetical protein